MNVMIFCGCDGWWYSSGDVAWVSDTRAGLIRLLELGAQY